MPKISSWITHCIRLWFKWKYYYKNVNDILIVLDMYYSIHCNMGGPLSARQRALWCSNIKVAYSEWPADSDGCCMCVSCCCSGGWVSLSLLFLWFIVGVVGYIWGFNKYLEVVKYLQIILGESYFIYIFI